MKITQMKFQKIVVKLAVLLAAISVFYALIFATQLYGFNDVVDTSGDIGYALWESIQPFNKTLFTSSIIYLVVSLSLLVFFTQSRRNYYISNYIVVGITSLFGIALSVYAITNVMIFMAEFMSIDFVAVNEYLASKNIATMTPIPWSFILGIILYLLIILDAVANVLNVVWKITEMKKDREDNAEIDAEIYAAWKAKEEELKEEASNYES